MRKNPAESTFILLANYSFELTETNINDLVFCWLSLYPSKWVVAAIVEAIYQGRYKVESVSRILNAWSIRGYPVHHFDYDFADVVCKKLANFGSYKTNNLIEKVGEEMEHSERIEDQEKMAQAARQIKAIAIDSRTTGKAEQTYKSTPNQKISNCERLVVHLSA